MLVGQHHRWQQDSTMGEQDHVLHLHRVWPCHLRRELNLGNTPACLPVCQRHKRALAAGSSRGPGTALASESGVCLLWHAPC